MFKINDKLEKILLKNKVPFAVDEKGIYTICESGIVYSIHCGEREITVKDSKHGNEFVYTSWLAFDININRVSKGGGFRVNLSLCSEEFLELRLYYLDDEEYLKEEFCSDNISRIINEEFEESKRDIEICGVSLCGKYEDEKSEMIKKMFSGAVTIEELEEIKEEITEKILSWVGTMGEFISFKINKIK